MDRITKLVEEMRNNPINVRFSDLKKACDHFFGEPRQSGTSHVVYRMPWAGDPRVVLQNYHGKAKDYQVRQAIRAIDKLNSEKGAK